MKQKKNIDRLFQEKFKDFEAHPSDQVWNNIVGVKKEKEDRKIVPIWWRLGGVAAIALLLITTGIALWNTTPETNNATPELVQSDQNQDSGESTRTTSIPFKETTPSFSNETTETDSGLALENTDTDTNTNDDVLTFEEDKTRKEKEENTLFVKNNTQQVIASQDKATALHKTNSKEKPNQVPSNTNHSPIVKSISNDIATAKEKESNTPQERSKFIDPTITIDKNAEENTSFAINEGITDASQNAEEENTKKSLVDEAARIAAINDEADNEKIKGETIARRWDVGAVAAPVYYGDFGGSGIDPEFRDNNKTSDISLSYGVQVSYAVTPKFKVRTGVSNVDLNYNTQDISFAASNEAQSLGGIEFSQNGSFFDIRDQVNPSSVTTNSQDGIGQGGNTFSDGEIQQDVGYVEIPLEAIYVLSDKRLGVELIGGVSTLVLNNNEVSLESDGLRTNLGTSSALNDVSFTTNVGLGLNYKVTKKVRLNVEPSLKYQLNAFDNSVGDFKPYYIGLYTGVNYRF